MAAIAVIDSETLKLDPKHPDKVVVDEIGVALYFPGGQPLSLETISAILEKSFGSILPGQATQEGQHGASIITALVKLPLIEQFVAGRGASQDTVEWHRKRGYNLELETRTLTVAEALVRVKKHLSDVDVVYCRGQDFDFPLLNSLLDGDETLCHYRKPGDIRTLHDALMMDFKFGLLTDERLERSPLFVANSQALTVAKKINAYRKELGHRASNDALLDLLMLILLREQQWLLLERFNALGVEQPV